MGAHFWISVTDFGDSALLLPCALLVAVWLFASPPTRRATAAWVGLSALAVATVVATKLAYMGWHVGIPALRFVGLSGHATLSFLVWPVLLFVMFGRTRVSAALGLAAGIALATLVCVSRIFLHAHTPSEVVLGALFGLGCSGAYLLCHRRVFPVALSRSRLLITAMLPMLLGYGRVMPSVQILAALSGALTGHAWIAPR